MRRLSAIFVTIVTTSMIGGATLAFRQAQQNTAPLETWALYGPPAKLARDKGLDPQAPKAGATDRLEVPASAPLTSGSGGSDLTAPSDVSATPRPVAALAVIPKANALTQAELDCTLDHYGRRPAIPVDRLVAIIRSGVDALRPPQSVDAVRAVVQADLNRSGDGPSGKSAALDRVRAFYPKTTVIGAALAAPFDLVDAPETLATYQACGTPALPTGAPYPFANVFFTINPVPVAASRLAETAEGGR